MHRIKMIFEESSPHFTPAKCSVEVDRDGTLEHAVDTFQAFLVAMGFTLDTAKEAADEFRVPTKPEDYV